MRTSLSTERALKAWTRLYLGLRLGLGLGLGLEVVPVDMERVGARGLENRGPKGLFRILSAGLGPVARLLALKLLFEVLQ